MHVQCLWDEVCKTAYQFQSYHQEEGALLVLSVVLPYLECQFRHLVVSREVLQTSQSEPKRCCSDMGRYRDTGTVDDMRRSDRQRLLLQLMTATYRFQLGGTLKATPPCWIILFVQPQDVLFWLKVYEIGCLTCNFTPDVHGEVHIWDLDTMERVLDGPKNTLNGLNRIAIKFYSQMSVA